MFVHAGQHMEKRRVEHRQNIENIKQEHKLHLQNQEHEVELQLSNLKSTTELGTFSSSISLRELVKRNPPVCWVGARKKLDTKGIVSVRFSSQLILTGVTFWSFLLY